MLLNPTTAAPQGLVKPGSSAFNARLAHFYCYHLVADFCCAVKPGWASVDQHQMSVALALNRLSPSILGFMNIFCRYPGNGKSNLLIWQCDDNSECTIEKFCRDLILFWILELRAQGWKLWSRVKLQMTTLPPAPPVMESKAENLREIFGAQVAVKTFWLSEVEKKTIESNYVNQQVDLEKIL